MLDKLLDCTDIAIEPIILDEAVTHDRHSLRYVHAQPPNAPKRYEQFGRPQLAIREQTNPTITLEKGVPPSGRLHFAASLKAIDPRQLP